MCCFLDVLVVPGFLVFVKFAWFYVLMCCFVCLLFCVCFVFVLLLCVCAFVCLFCLCLLIGVVVVVCFCC